MKVKQRSNNVQIKERHKQAFEEYNKNGFKISKALEKGGFSPTVCKSPTKVTTTKSWNMLIEKYLPDDLKARKHRTLLDSKNENIVWKALEGAYKLEEKGGYAKQSHQDSDSKVLNITNIMNIIQSD